VARALDARPVARTWILTSMSVALAAVLLTVGAMADDHGRRRTFVAGSVALAVGSVLCALAGHATQFLLGRLVEGLGAAAVLAAGLGMVAAVATTPAQRARASGVWGASVGAGIALGPVLTGLLDEVHAWRAFYAALAAGSLGLAAVTHRRVNESVAASARPADLPGAVTLGGALVLALVALVDGRHGISVEVALETAGAVALAATFVVVERRRAHPMLDLRLFRHPPFAAATLAAFGTGLAVIGVMSFACSFLITSAGLSSLEAALVLFAWSGTSAASALLARHLPARFGGVRQLALGLAGVALGELAMIGQLPGSPWRLVPGLVLAGVASGVLNAGLGREAVTSVPADRAALGSGANNTARYLGSSVGVTLVVVIATNTGPGRSAAVDGWNHALLVSAALGGVTAVALLAVHRAASPIRSTGRTGSLRSEG
jgi:MFS family permease